MKWIFSCLFVCCFCTEVLADTPLVIYNLENTKPTATRQAKNHFYIKTARFLKAAKANQYRTFIRSKTTYPVKIIYKKPYYVVLIGPISQISEARRTAKHLLAGKSKLRHKATPREPSPWFVSVGGGLAFPDFNSNLTVANHSGFPGVYSQDTYSTNKNNQGLFELTFGRRWQHAQRWLPSYSLGLSYLHLFTTNMGGTITQYSAPAFTNYNYNWDTSADAFLAGLKLNLFQSHKLSPFITGKLGFSLNKSGNYSEGPLPGLTDTRVSAGFQTQTTTQFAYTVGAGLDYQTTPKILLSAEYQYQNLGNMSLGKGLGTWSSQSLSLGQYTTSAVLLKLTYLLG